MSYLLQRYTKRGQNENEIENMRCDVIWIYSECCAIHSHTKTGYGDIYILIRKLNKWCFTVVNDSGLPIEFVSVRCVRVRFERIHLFDFVHFLLYQSFHLSHPFTYTATRSFFTFALFCLDAVFCFVFICHNFLIQTKCSGAVIRSECAPLVLTLLLLFWKYTKFLLLLTIYVAAVFCYSQSGSKCILPPWGEQLNMKFWALFNELITFNKNNNEKIPIDERLSIDSLAILKFTNLKI